MASFYKILLDPSALHMPLPANFVSKHLENKIPDNPILRCVNGGFSWMLKIKRVDEDYCFTDGWKNVVNDIQLGFGDFLLFRLVDQSTFEVSVFSPNGCEKSFISETHIQHDENVVDDNDDDDDHDEVEDEDGGGDDEDDGGGCDIDGDDGDPFFVTTISKSHKTLLRLPSEFVDLAGIGGERTITLKNPDGKEWQLALRLEKGKGLERYYLSSGWNEFQRVNDLCEGDECVFKFKGSDGKLCLVKVTRKKASARQPTCKVEVVKRKRGRPRREHGGCVEEKTEDDRAEVLKREFKSKCGVVQATEVVKRKRGRPPKSKHCVVPGTEVVQRKSPPRDHGGCVEVVKRPVGRPPKSKSCVA